MKKLVAIIAIAMAISTPMASSAGRYDAEVIMGCPNPNSPAPMRVAYDHITTLTCADQTRIMTRAREYSDLAGKYTMYAAAMPGYINIGNGEQRINPPTCQLQILANAYSEAAAAWEFLPANTFAQYEASAEQRYSYVKRVLTAKYAANRDICPHSGKI
jgi:hypothetical protein